MFTVFAYAQEDIVAPKNLSSINTTGASAYGNNGSVSYSVGQVFFTSDNQSSGTIDQGVQQTFTENKELLQLPDQEKSVEITAYPNPMTNYLSIDLDSFNDKKYAYKLFDLNGRLVKENILTNTLNTITAVNLPSSTYVLRVYADKKPIRTFKIIKK